MVYYKDEICLIRNLEKDDIEEIVREECAQGWQASDAKYLMRIKNQEEEKCISFVAEYKGSVAGYVNLYFCAKTGPFAFAAYPEIVDFGVLEKYRRQGIGTRLMDVAEEIGFQSSYVVCIGVGLHSGYGSAQRMYVKRGYVPDGSGVWYRDKVCEPYEKCCNDDDLVLYLSKNIETQNIFLDKKL